MSRLETGRMVRRLSLLAILALIGSTVFSASSLAASGGKDRFHASASDEGEGAEASELHDLQHFDEVAEANPVVGAAALFSQCRFTPFNGATNIYPGLAANEHDVIKGDTLSTFADGTQCYNPQNEQNLVINPTNRNNIVTSSNDYRYDFGACWAYVSTNGGATWTDVVMPGWTNITGAKGQFVKTGCGGDPVMAFAPDGTLYFAALTYNVDKFPRQMSGVAVGVSKDGGLHWSAPKMVSFNAAGNFFYDKEWIGVGNDGTVFLTWTKFYQGPKGLGYIKSPIVMASSKNQGTSWSSVKEVSDAAHPYNQGSQVAMAPNGDLYVSYEGASPSTGYNTDAVVVARSTNGGTSFTNAEVARAFDDLDCYPIQLPGGQGRQTLSGEQFRLPLNPSLAIDPTTGTLAIGWADNEGVGSCGNGGTTFTDGPTSNQVKVVTSNDGTHWTLHRITSSGPDKAIVAVGANAGTIAVGYYTRDYATAANDPLCEAKLRDAATGTITVLSTQNVCLDWALKTSTDGGATWSSQKRISSHSSNPYILFSGSFIGDYEGTAVDDQGKVFTVWTDFRGNPGVTSPNQDTLVGTIPAH
ncbi:MAG: sialidase family protein [Chloroflexota bacterium]